MPNTRSTKKGSPYKALKTPHRSPRNGGDTHKKAKSKKKNKDASRMDRMEEQIIALTSLVSAHLSMASGEATTPTKKKDRAEADSPKRAKTKRRDKAFLPPPEAMADDPAIEEQIVDAIKYLDPSFRTTGGKKSTPGPSTRPHLYVPKRFRMPKASEQEDFPFPQFVTGMAGMVLSMLDDQSSPAAAACRHLREAAEDHITRTWSVVREWSKTMFDRLNLGEIAWDDYDEMQRERIKICFSAPPKVPIIIPCPYFSAGNCEFTEGHEEGQLSMRHICPFCYASGAGRQDHPIFRCNSKKAYNTAPKQQFNRQQAKPTPGNPQKN